LQAASALADERRAFLVLAQQSVEVFDVAQECAIDGHSHRIERRRVGAGLGEYFTQELVLGGREFTPLACAQAVHEPVAYAWPGGSVFSLADDRDLVGAPDLGAVEAQ
jgi:hypothetical protein